jgi:hypothetical protein
MGYDKLLEKVKCNVIESCDDGGQLAKYLRRLPIDPDIQMDLLASELSVNQIGDDKLGVRI